MIQSIERAFTLLAALDEQGREGAALGDLAARTGLKTPTAHNLLQTLVELGYATHHVDTRQYGLGKKAWALGRQQFLAGSLAEIALPVLRNLQATFNETVLLTLYRDGLRHTVASVESRHSLRVGGQTGVDDHLYSTATGRVLLSRLGHTALGSFINNHGLPGEDWPEAATEAALRRELSRIRKERFISYDRPEGHIRATAVPVPISEPDTHAALGMYYPTARPPKEGIPKLRKLLTGAAVAIAAQFER